MITKNSVMKIQNLVVNHESWPIKSNTGNSGKKIYKLKSYNEMKETV